MGFSVTESIFAGSYEFDLSFSLGYDKQTDITVEVDNGVDLPVPASFDFLTDTRIIITSPTLNTGETVRLIRTVSKTAPAVDVTQPSNLDRESVQKLFLQSMYVMHEVLDGRVADVAEIDSEVLTLVTEAVTTAIEQSGLVATYRFPVQIGGALTEAIVAMNGDELYLESVGVYVETNPNTLCEILISDTAKVVYSFTVSTGGVVTETYSLPDTEVILEGPLTMTVVGDNYSTGIEIQAVVVGTSAEFLSFATEFPDLTATYTQAKTT